MVVTTKIRDWKIIVLRQRIITAALLMLALIAATTLLSSFNFAVLFALLTLLATWEWSGFIGLNEPRSKVIYCSTIASMIFGLFFLLRITPAAQNIDAVRAAIILGLGLLFWTLALFMLSTYPQNKNLWNDESKIASMGMFTLIPTWVGLVQLKYLLPDGYLVLVLIVLVAAVDVGAYFFGVNFGRRKLAPNVSPKKSWEGVWGGFTVCLLIGLGFAWMMHTYLLELSIWRFLLLGVLILCVTFFSVVGDLLESMLKRNQNIKDSGSLLPGHGGLLDRVDGLMAATPSFVLLTMLILGDSQYA